MNKPLLVLAVFLASLAAAAADYEVTIDGKTYPFMEDVEQKIPVKGGQWVTVSVSVVETKVFEGYGISFRYPIGMKLSQESFYGIQQITVESTDSSLFMIQVFPAGVSADQTQKDLLEGFREQFANLGARFPEKPTKACQRSIGAEVRAGMALSCSLGSISNETEIYMIGRGGRAVALVFNYSGDDKDEVLPVFDAIGKSFK